MLSSLFIVSYKASMQSIINAVYIFSSFMHATSVFCSLEYLFIFSHVFRLFSIIVYLIIKTVILYAIFAENTFRNCKYSVFLFSIMFPASFHLIIQNGISSAVRLFIARINP